MNPGVNTFDPVKKLFLGHCVFGDVACTAARNRIRGGVSAFRIDAVNTVCRKCSVKYVFEAFGALVRLVSRRGSTVVALCCNKLDEFFFRELKRDGFNRSVSPIVAVHVPQVGRSFFFATYRVYRHFMGSKAATASTASYFQIVVPGLGCSTAGALAKISAHFGLFAVLQSVYERFYLPYNGEPFKCSACK